MSGIRIALLLTTSERYVGLILNFLTMAVISRLLTPAEVGISVIGWAILSIPFALRDLGMTDFIIQRKRLTDDATRTAASLGLLTGLVLVGLVYASAPLIQRLYADPRIGQYLDVVMFAMLTDAIMSPLLALMRRDLAFHHVVCVNITLYLTAAVVTIALAWAGGSYMSIAWGTLLSNVAAAALAVTLRPQLWVFRPTLRRWREVLGFGAYFSTMSVLVRTYESFPYLVLGRFASASAIGHFSRAMQTCQLPDKLILSGIVSVAFPALAAEARSGRDLKAPYLGAIQFMTAVQWPALVLLAILAPRVVAIVFGDQWADIVPMVQIMALAWGFSAAASLTYPILYAIGNLRHALASTVLSLPVSALIMTIAAMFGPMALAASLFITVPFNNLVAYLYIRRHLDVTWRDLGRAVRKSAIVTLASAASPLALIAAHGLSFEQPLWLQGVMIVCAAAGWLTGLWLTSHPLLAELQRAVLVLRARIGAGRKSSPFASAAAQETP